MIKLGDKLRREISFGAPDAGGSGHIPTMATGTVVYIHPLWRFYVLEFQFEQGGYCESYYFPDKEDEP